jgi:hypothetical protein
MGVQVFYAFSMCKFSYSHFFAQVYNGPSSVSSIIANMDRGLNEGLVGDAQRLKQISQCNTPLLSLYT